MDHAQPQQPVPTLPTSIWVLGYAFLAQQLLALAVRESTNSAPSVVLSMALSGLVVGFFAAGVVRARPIRVAIVWILMVLGTAFGMLGFVQGASIYLALSLCLSAVELMALYEFTRSDWYAFQRDRTPIALAQPVTGIVALGVAVGVLGGINGAQAEQLNITVKVAPAHSETPSLRHNDAHV